MDSFWRRLAGLQVDLNLALHSTMLQALWAQALRTARTNIRWDLGWEVPRLECRTLARMLSSRPSCLVLKFFFCFDISEDLRELIDPGETRVWVLVALRNAEVPYVRHAVQSPTCMAAGMQPYKVRKLNECKCKHVLFSLALLDGEGKYLSQTMRHFWGIPSGERLVARETKWERRIPSVFRV